MDVTPSNRETIIWLSSMNFTSNSIRSIMNNLKQLKEIWNLSEVEVRSKLPLSKTLQDKIILNRKFEDLKLYIKQIKKLEVSIITILDADYPEKLKYIADRPKILYIKGKPLVEDFTMAMVGSRKSTNYGAWACSKFSGELSKIKVNIVSGMATGIDSIAHRQCLESGGHTIAVLGSGIDIIYPKKNKGLYEDILDKGTIISEYPIGTPPKPYNFPLRNRIISGLSDGVIIVEAKEKSGSLITANYALDQGKNIFAIPGNINSIFSGGTNKLIKDGAIPLLNIRDILDEYEELEGRLMEKISISSEDDFSAEEIKLLDLLDQPMHSDDIVYRMEIDIASINTILVELELRGLVKEIGNNIFIRN